MPAFSSSLISPTLEQLAGLPAGDRELLATGQPGPGLLEYLARVPDRATPAVSAIRCARCWRRRAAVLAGSRSFAAIGEWIADAPPTRPRLARDPP